MNDSLSHLGALLRDASRIGIACHVRPDGDAIGSIVGLGRSLQLMGKAVSILSEDGVPANLTFLAGSELVQVSQATPLELDVAVALDTAAKDRLGERTLSAFQNAPVLINVDHHGTNPRYGHYNHIDSSAPAAGQLVYDLLQVSEFPMDAVVRENLFAAISTDTGSFQYSSTNPRTHRIVAEMMEAGLDTASLATKLYQTNPMRRVMLQKALLNEMKFTCGQQVASWALPQSLQLEIQIQPGDTEGLIDVMRSIEGVVAAVIFEELSDGRVRVSARSKDSRVNVSRVCAEFGGGGHIMAAGARLPGPISDAESRFLEALKNEIERTG
jgi:phosphoesterase RecJ-like protein